MNNAYIRLMIFLYTAEKSTVDFEIAMVLLKNFYRFPDILIEDIAKLANTTPASVTKFCHKLKYKNFKELRNDCHNYEDHRYVDDKLEIAEQDYRKACEAYLKEEQHNLEFYMRYHDEQMIFDVAKLMLKEKETSVIYTPYSYICVHVLRSFLETYGVHVQGIMRDLDEDFMETRLAHTSVCWVINLQGEWINSHKEWLLKQKEKGKKLVIITATYDDGFKDITPYIFPFQFRDTILDTATQISCLFVKIAFAYANFTKIEKTESSIS